MAKRLSLVIFLAAAIAAAYFLSNRTPSDLVLTGVITGEDVIVSPQLAGRIERLLVKEGDKVSRDQVLAVLSAGELSAEQTFYASEAESSADQMHESEAGLRFQQLQVAQRIREADAQLAAALAQRAEAVANAAHAKHKLERDETIRVSGGLSEQAIEESRNAYAVAQARQEALDRQIEAQRAAVALARAAGEQVLASRSRVEAAERQLAAAAAQKAKADLRLGYTELHAPLSGVVDVRVAHAGEVVSPGQPVLALIDPDALWVRADVEESYIDRVRLGDRLSVRLASGETRTGTVYYRAVDAGFATQRDVSRVKRDIKTFEIRLRVDNADRRLAVGMTAYVSLHLVPVS